MTIDRAIELLQEARLRLGGQTPVWVQTHDMKTKWDEELVQEIEPIDDGESRYVRVQTVREH